MKIWFQNRRMKWKRSKKNFSSGHKPSSGDSSKVTGDTIPTDMDLQCPSEAEMLDDENDSDIEVSDDPDVVSDDKLDIADRQQRDMMTCGDSDVTTQTYSVPESTKSCSSLDFRLTASVQLSSAGFMGNNSLLNSASAIS